MKSDPHPTIQKRKARAAHLTAVSEPRLPGARSRGETARLHAHRPGRELVTPRSSMLSKSLRRSRDSQTRRSSSPAPKAWGADGKAATSAPIPQQSGWTSGVMAGQPNGPSRPTARTLRHDLNLHRLPEGWSRRPSNPRRSRSSRPRPHRRATIDVEFETKAVMNERVEERRLFERVEVGTTTA